MTVDIELKRGITTIREKSDLTTNFVESSPINHRGFNQIELGFVYGMNVASPPGAKAVIKIQFSPDGETYFDYATGYDFPPPPLPATETRTILLSRQFEIYGIASQQIALWYAIPSAAQFFKVFAKEENGGGNFGSLEILGRVSDV